MQLKKAPPPVSDINVTPMVDVMLVVLIIFYGHHAAAQQERQYHDLARARNPIVMADAEKEDAVVVAITARDGQSYFSALGLAEGPSRKIWRPK